MGERKYGREGGNSLSRVYIRTGKQLKGMKSSLGTLGTPRNKQGRTVVA